MAGIHAGRGLAHQRQRITQLRQRGGDRIETISDFRLRQRAPAGAARRQGFHCVAQAAQGKFQRRHRLLQGRLRTGHAAAFGEAVAGKFLPRAHAETFAEKVGGQFRQLMGLVDDEGLRARQDFAETLLLQREVGQQQMVVDHHQIRFLRTLACTHHEAVAPERTIRAHAVVHRGGDHRQQWRIIGQAIQLGHVAVLAAPGPGHDALELRHLLGAAEARLAARLIQTVTAQVVGPALQQRGTMAHPQRRTHARQVAVIELVLQRAGAGGHDGLQTGQQHRYQVGVGLAGSRARLGQQHIALLQRIGDGSGEPLLRCTRHERIQCAGKRAPFAQGFTAGGG